MALGADYDMAATPGFEEGGHEYYTLAGAERLRDALDAFDGGQVLVSVLGQPFKCPPAPFEGSFLLHEHFTQRGIRDSVQMTMTFPMQRPVPVTGRGLADVPRRARRARHRGASPAARHQHRSGEERWRSWRAARRCPTTCSSASPSTGRPTRSPASGLAVDGWVPVDQTNLRTQFPGVYAIGDVCTGPRTVPKAGIFAESAALRRRRRHRGRRSPARSHPRRTRGRGICYAEFGDGLVSKVEVNFLGGPSPVAERNEPSLAYAAEKEEFGATRRARWFGR